MNLHLFLYIVNNLLNLLEVSILDVLRLWTFLLGLLLAALELVTTRLSCCATLLVHLL